MENRALSQPAVFQHPTGKLRSWPAIFQPLEKNLSGDKLCSTGFTAAICWETQRNSHLATVTGAKKQLASSRLPCSRLGGSAVSSAAPLQSTRLPRCGQLSCPTAVSSAARCGQLVCLPRCSQLSRPAAVNSAAPLRSAQLPRCGQLVKSRTRPPHCAVNSRRLPPAPLRSTRPPRCKQLATRLPRCGQLVAAQELQHF